MKNYLLNLSYLIILSVCFSACLAKPQLTKNKAFLDPYFSLAKAEKEQAKGNYDLAKSMAEALLLSPTATKSKLFFRRVKKILADIAVVQKNVPEIINTHKSLLTNGHKENETLLFNLATALDEAQDKKFATDIYKKLLINFPHTDQAKKIENISSISKYNLSINELEKRFDNLIKKLEFNQVVLEVDELLQKKSLSEDEKSILKTFAIKALVLNNQFSEGVDKAKIAAKNNHPKTLESYAWGLAKVDRFMEAFDIYSQMGKQAQKIEDKAKACFFAGFSLYEASLYTMARLSWQNCAEHLVLSEYHENFLWHEALSYMLEDNFVEAKDKLVDLNQKFAQSEQKQKYLYFLGFCLNRLHQYSKAEQVFNKLITFKKPDYYNLLARRTLKLKEPIGSRVTADAFMKKTLSLDIKDAAANALVLYNAGFIDEAYEEILSSALKMEDKLSLLQYIGNFHEVWQRAYLLDNKLSLLENKLSISSNIRASYPLPHEETVNKISLEYDLHQSLIYAVLRTESAFLAEAESIRGALGLMQMMPFVAKDLAHILDLKNFHHDKLKDPKIAIQFGSLFLASLKQQFGKAHLMIAAYNAGPHQVQKWLNRFGHLPTELFIERIPFKQTRAYVKEVLSSESLYHALDGQTLRLLL